MVRATCLARPPPGLVLLNYLFRDVLFLRSSSSMLPLGWFEPLHAHPKELLEQGWGRFCQAAAAAELKD